MKIESEILTRGDQALIAALGLVGAVHFVVALYRDKLGYTPWCKTDLPSTAPDALADQSSQAMRQRQRYAS